MSEKNKPSLRDALKNLASKKPEETEETVPFGTLRETEDSIYPTHSEPEFTGIAEEMKGISPDYKGSEDMPPSLVEKKPRTSEAFHAEVKKLRAFLKLESVERFHWKLTVTGTNAILHQGGITDMWARIDKTGTLKIYRTLLTRVLLRENYDDFKPGDTERDTEDQ